MNYFDIKKDSNIGFFMFSSPAKNTRFRMTKDSILKHNTHSQPNHLLLEVSAEACQVNVSEQASGIVGKDCKRRVVGKMVCGG